MPPHHVILVRHGQRIDHVDGTWNATAERPNDSPLTVAGHQQAGALGRFLARAVDTKDHPAGEAVVDLARVAFLVSPLTRCVETAHHIREALVSHHSNAAAGDISSSGTTGRPLCPLFVEESLVENSHWQSHDMRKNPALLDPTDPQRLLQPKVIYPDAAFHAANTSPHVSLAPSAATSWSMILDPVVVPADYRAHIGSAAGNFVYYDASSGELKDVLTLQERVHHAARLVAKYPEEGAALSAYTTWIMVGHGLTCETWYSELLGVPKERFEVDYTSFTHFRQAGGQQQKGSATRAAGTKGAFVATCEPFRSPHLYLKKK